MKVSNERGDGVYKEKLHYKKGDWRIDKKNIVAIRTVIVI